MKRKKLLVVLASVVLATSSIETIAIAPQNIQAAQSVEYNITC